MKVKEVMRPRRAKSGELGLFPTCQRGFDLLASLDVAERDVMVALNTARNPRHHRLFFALVNIVKENAPVEITTEAIVLSIKHGVGHVIEWTDPHGEVHRDALSISFESMSQKDFNEFFNKAIRYVCEVMLKDTSFDDVRQQIYDAVQ